MVRLAQTTPQEISSQAGHFRYLEKTGSSLTILRSSGYASWRDHRDFPVHIRHVSSAIALFSRECAILHRTPGRVVAFFLNEEERTHPPNRFPLYRVLPADPLRRQRCVWVFRTPASLGASYRDHAADSCGYPLRWSTVLRRDSQVKSSSRVRGMSDSRHLACRCLSARVASRQARGPAKIPSSPLWGSLPG